jgi:ATP-dependent RNA helicase RhlE
VDILVATPGRLLDHFRFPYAKLHGLEYLVLDEADRMLDMGFFPDIRRILRHIPARRQTFFFSATIPSPIVALSREMLRAPVMINLDRQAAPPVGITQAIYPVPQGLKPALLLALLRRGEIREALVFTRTKHRADRLARYLVGHGIKAERIHGNRSQIQRSAALAGFKNKRFRVLVATDIAARGIDIEALSHVVNFDVPKAPDDYIHRVGRTGRVETTGDAFTLVAPEEEEELRRIERVLGKRLPWVTLPDFDYKGQPEGRLEKVHPGRRGGTRAAWGQDRPRGRTRVDHHPTRGRVSEVRQVPAQPGLKGDLAHWGRGPRRGVRGRRSR